MPFSRLTTSKKVARIYDNSTIMEEMYKSDGKYYEIRNEWKRVYFFCNIVIGVGHSLKGCFRILWILNNFNNIDSIMILGR